MKYELTERHRNELKPWAERWIANAMSTKQMDDEEKEITKKAILGIYAAAKLPATIISISTAPASNRVSGANVGLKLEIGVDAVVADRHCWYSRIRSMVS